MMMSLFDALFLGALALLVLYFYLTWNYNYWKKLGVRSDKPSLLFGTIADNVLGKRPLGAIFYDIYQKYPDEKVVGWFKFRTPGLMVRDPELIHRILVTDFHSFRNNDAHIDANLDPILGNNLFVLKDEKWKRRRAFVTPAFTAGKIKAIFPVMKEVSKDLVSYIKQHPEDIEVKPLMSRYTAEITARCAFGFEGLSFKESKPEIHEVGKKVFQPSLLINLKMLSFFMAPKISKLLRLKVVPQKVLDFFDTVLRDVIIYRQDNNIERNDFVHYMLEAKKKSLEVAKGNIESDIIKNDPIMFMMTNWGKDPQSAWGKYPLADITNDDVLSGCIMFFLESFETASLIANNILYNLALNKDVQENLRNEIDATLQEGELTFEKLHEMPYLNSVFLESNRVLPALYFSLKLCTETYRMDIGKEKPLIIEKGTSIVLPTYPIHNDPLYWEEPHLFKPERFANKEEANAKTKGIYLPFGDGPRMCPGMRLATTLIKLALVKILSNFEVLPTSRTPRKIQFDPKYFMIGHKGGIYLKFVERPT